MTLQAPPNQLQKYYPDITPVQHMLNYWPQGKKKITIKKTHLHSFKFFPLKQNNQKIG